MQFTPEMQEQFGKAWAALALSEGHLPLHRIAPPCETTGRGRPPTAREAVIDILSDGAWHGPREVMDRLGVCRRRANSLLVEVGAVKRGRNGCPAEWRLE